MLKTFRYRLYTPKAQQTKLRSNLRLCCALYNAALQERRDAYRKQNISINFSQQSAQLTSVKADCSEYRTAVYSQVLQDTLHRLDKAFKAFFRRVKRHETPGYPRFKSWRRYNSLTYPQTGFRLESDRLFVSKIGYVPVTQHRPLEGKVKTCTIRREPTGKWHVTLVCEVKAKPLPTTDNVIALDLGIIHFATLNDGSTIANPKFFKRDAKRLAKAQRKAQRTKDYRPVRAVHERIKNRRTNFAHQLSHKLINQNDTIIIENLNVKPMLEERKLSASIADAAWSQFNSYLTYKAEEAGRLLVRVNSAYTTQNCSQCGQVKPKTLGQRWHSCECGCELDRDHNAALNILALGLQGRGPPGSRSPAVYGGE